MKLKVSFKSLKGRFCRLACVIFILLVSLSFAGCNNSKFNTDISEWDVSNVKDIGSMFNDTSFNQDISKWNVLNVTNYYKIFDNCPIEEKYKPKFK